MDAVISYMPLSFNEHWWTTEPQLHSWDDSAAPRAFDTYVSTTVASTS